MSIALVVPGTLWDQPFVRTYSEFLSKSNVEYDIISWNRDGRDKAEGIQYNYRQPLNSNRFLKLFGYLRFAQFAKKWINKNNYSKLIIFGPQIGLFIPCLLKKYTGSYIFDYRDLSIEQMSIFHSTFRKVLENSYANIISSPGFMRALPAGYDFLVCHNFNIDMVEATLNRSNGGQWNIGTPIKILTIGGIRDYSSNSEVIRALANNPNYLIQFVGRGIAADALKSYCEMNSVKNVEFKGFYHKEEEPNFIKSASFLNIYYPRKLSHDTALSNRFYNSLIFKRPMIVTKNTTQGDLAEQYKVGVAIENCNNISESLLNFLENDYLEYSNRCDELLRVLLVEQKSFYNKLTDFIK